MLGHSSLQRPSGTAAAMRCPVSRITPVCRRACQALSAADLPSASSPSADNSSVPGTSPYSGASNSDGASTSSAATPSLRPLGIIKPGAGLRPADPARELNLAYESEKKLIQPAQVQGAVKTTGLHRAPLSGGVRTATSRYDLPSPPTAVRNLVEHARFGHLCTVMSGMHHRRSGYPFGTLIDFAADGAGYPFFCLSPLAIHARNIIEEPRSSLVVQMPGWTGLANARVTIFGDVFQLPPDMQATARDIFLAKHSNERKERWVSGNFVYFRMNKIVDIYFVGGFGTVQWIDPQEYLASRPDDVVLDSIDRTLQVLNEMFAAELKQLQRDPIDELMFISIDATGADIRIRQGSEFSIERLGFDSRVHNLQQSIDAVKKVVASVAASRGIIQLH